MRRSLPAPAPRAATADREHDPRERSCPRCGDGDLFTLDVGRGDGRRGRGAYCAGLYDRDRRRFLRRSCGYTDYLREDAGGAGAGAVRAAANSSPAFQSGIAAASATLSPM